MSLTETKKEPLKIYIPYIDPDKPFKPENQPVAVMPDNWQVGLDADSQFYVTRAKDYIVGNIYETIKHGLNQSPDLPYWQQTVALKPIWGAGFGIDFLINLGEIQSRNGDAAAHAYFSAAVTTGVSTLGQMGIGSATAWGVTALFAVGTGPAAAAGFAMGLIAAAAYDGISIDGVTASQFIADLAANTYDKFATEEDPEINPNAHLERMGTYTDIEGGFVVNISQASEGGNINFDGVRLEGELINLGNGLYQKGDIFFLKEGNDLFIMSNDSPIQTLIKGYFSNNYNENEPYSNMGITIPASNENGIINKISDSISSAYHEMLYAIKKALIMDPLIVDLNNNGIALDSWQASNTLFDITGDGIKDNTGWTKANSDDAFLVIDKNNNGKIDNINEMFGNTTTKGFIDLKSYDSNADGIINSTDTQFSLLRLWNDKNANGIVDTGEMTALAANNITSISLNSYYRPDNIGGNIQDFVSTVTKTDGTTRNIHEFHFAFDSALFTTNPDLRLPSTFQLNIESVMLPYSRGYGNLYSWQAAMTLDPQLLAMAQDIMAMPLKDLYKIHDKFEAFLFRWAGVENVTAGDIYVYSNGKAPDARKIAFLEKITGEDFIYANKTSSLSALQAWEMFFNEFLNKFLVQGSLASAFPKASYDFATDTLKFNDTLDNVIAGIKTQAAGMDANSFTHYAFYAQNILKLNKGQFADTAFDTKIDAGSRAANDNAANDNYLLGIVNYSLTS